MDDQDLLAELRSLIERAKVLGSKRTLPALERAVEAIEHYKLANDALVGALKSFGVLSCTPEWQEKRNAALAKATEARP